MAAALCGIRHNAAENIINQIVGAGREEQFIKKIPEMQKRWSAEKGSMPRYVAGAGAAARQGGGEA
jgi:hypothetical protein